MTAIAAAPDPFSELDVLVLSQGTVLYGRKEFQPAGWDKVMAVNLDSVMHCSQRFKPKLAARKGSIVVVGNTTYEVPAAPVSKVVDTTGAGDLYAAGFLYGYTRGEHLADCARLGGIAAAEIISHVGARPETALKALV